MPRSLRHVLILLCLGGLLAAAPACAPHRVDAEDKTADAAAPGAHQAASADDIKVLDIEDLAALLQQHHGRITVVNFWATWCPPCVKEMPEFAQFYQAHKQSAEVALISVSADHPDTIQSALKPFLTKHEIPFPVFVMNFGPSEDLAKILGYEWVNGSLPATFVYDTQGTIRNAWFVGITKADLDKAVDKIRAASASG